MPSLTNALARVQRAQDHIDEIKTEQESLARAVMVNGFSNLSISINATGEFEDVTNTTWLSVIDDEAPVRL